VIFEGTYVASVTPFKAGQVDETALRQHLRFMLQGGVDGIVACGTTGESPTLTTQEWSSVVRIAVEECATKPVIAGTGSNNTAATVEKTLLAKSLGASAALVVVPYYNKPTQAGLLAHFAAVAEVGLPIILYNIPGRTSRNMEVSTVLELSRLPNVVGIKEASGSLDAVGSLLAQAGPGFSVLSGDDSLSLPMYALGAHGVIATTGNLTPREMSSIYNLFKKGDIAGARAAHFKLRPLFNSLFIESNPAPLKYALSLLGKLHEDVRLPLVTIEESTKAAVQVAMRQAGLL